MASQPEEGIFQNLCHIPVVKMAISECLRQLDVVQNKRLWFQGAVTSVNDECFTLDDGTGCFTIEMLPDHRCAVGNYALVVGNLIVR